MLTGRPGDKVAHAQLHHGYAAILTKHVAFGVVPAIWCQTSRISQATATLQAGPWHHGLVLDLAIAAIEYHQNMPRMSRDKTRPAVPS